MKFPSLEVEIRNSVIILLESSVLAVASGSIWFALDVFPYGIYATYELVYSSTEYYLDYSGLVVPCLLVLISYAYKFAVW